MSLTMEHATDRVGEAQASTRIGAVGLVVRDLALSIRFYEDVIGLRPLERSGPEASLGVDGRPLICLHEDRDALPDDPKSAGLFHTAFLLPSREALGRWLNHAAERQVPLEGASDHLVSDAVYLSDPEGNGIEIYADRPREEWRWHDGEVEMDTLPLDLRNVAAAAEGAWQGAPSGTTIGHSTCRSARPTKPRHSIGLSSAWTSSTAAIPAPGSSRARAIITMSARTSGAAAIRGVATRRGPASTFSISCWTRKDSRMRLRGSTARRRSRTPRGPESGSCGRAKSSL